MDCVRRNADISTGLLKGGEEGGRRDGNFEDEMSRTIGCGWNDADDNDNDGDNDDVADDNDHSGYLDGYEDFTQQWFLWIKADDGVSDHK